MSSLQGRHYRQMVEIQESVSMHSTECFWQSVSAWVASKAVDEWEPKERLFMERKWKGLASIQARKVTQISHTRMYTWMGISKKTEKNVLAPWPDFSSQLVYIYYFWRGFSDLERGSCLMRVPVLSCHSVRWSHRGPQPLQAASRTFAFK